MNPIERDPSVPINSEVGAFWRFMQLLRYSTQDIEVFDEKYEWVKKQRRDRRIPQRFDEAGKNPIMAIEDMYAIIEDLERRLTGRTPYATLREEAKFHEEFVNECTGLIPEGYDGDEAPEAIILRYLKDMDALGGILARLTSSYR